MELRMPEKVSSDDCIKKYNQYAKLEFTEGEVEFFNKFIESNKSNGLGCYSELDNTYKEEQVNYAYTVPNFRINSSSSNGTVTIIKLEDDWYLITTYIHAPIGYEFYICDEWEEVIGYLSTNHNFKV